MQVFYTVRAGDTTGNIAARWNIPVNSLINANNLTAPYTIYPGQQLSMPPGVTNYVVKSGESVYSISRRYGIPVNVILQANGIEPPYIIVPGQVLTIPSGVPYYIVRPGDTLFKIAVRYNVILNGQVRTDYIIQANSGLTTAISPGMAIAVPWPPPGGPGKLAVLLNDGLNFYLGLYEPNSGKLNTFEISKADESTNIFWSPDQTRIAMVDSTGVISIIDIATKRVSNIDRTVLPGFVDWASDSRRIVYSTGRVIRIYDVLNNSFREFNRPGASYPQWFPNGTQLLYEAEDTSGISQLYRSNTDGSSETLITNNSQGLYNNVRLSPNGRFVLYTTPGVSISEIYTIELATGNIYKIPGGPEAKNYYPAWSPDSNKIAYSSTQFINGKYYSLIRMSGVKGEGDSVLTISGCYSTPVTWSPDSRKIAYLSGCGDENRPVEVWSIDTGKPAPVNVLNGYFFYNIDWSATR